MPRARAREWHSTALPRYARMTKQVEALIAGAYLSGTNTRRVRRALGALFRGAVSKDTVSRTWREVQTDLYEVLMSKSEISMRHSFLRRFFGGGGLPTSRTELASQAAGSLRIVQSNSKNEPRGARHARESIAPQPCIRLDPRGVRTMKQSFASAARLRGGGPILTNGIEDHVPARVTATSDRHRPAGAKARRAPKLVCLRSSLTWPVRPLPQHDAVRDFAGGDHAPERDEQLAGERDDHRRLARALGALGPGPEPLRQRAVLLKHEEPPGELDHAAAHPGIARFGETFLTSLGAAFVGRAR